MNGNFSVAKREDLAIVIIIPACALQMNSLTQIFISNASKNKNYIYKNNFLSISNIETKNSLTQLFLLSNSVKIFFLLNKHRIISFFLFIEASFQLTYFQLDIQAYIN